MAARKTALQNKAYWTAAIGDFDETKDEEWDVDDYEIYLCFDDIVENVIKCLNEN